MSRRVSIAAVAAVLGLALAACGSSTNNSSGGTTSTTASSTTTTALNTQAATAEITALYTEFFDGTNTNLTARELLLDNYKRYTSLYSQLYNSPAAKSAITKAKVNAVAFPSSAQCQASVKHSVCAKVSYDLLAASTGAPLLAGQAGYAVYVDGKWLVADSTFCSLASLALPNLKCQV